MKHAEQAREVLNHGVLGPAFFIVPLSEGSWVDRCVMSAMAKKVLGHPAGDEVELKKLITYWLERADDPIVMRFLEESPPSRRLLLGRCSSNGETNSLRDFHNGGAWLILSTSAELPGVLIFI